MHQCSHAAATLMQETTGVIKGNQQHQTQTPHAHSMIGLQNSFRRHHSNSQSHRPGWRSTTSRDTPAQSSGLPRSGQSTGGTDISLKINSPDPALRDGPGIHPHTYRAQDLPCKLCVQWYRENNKHRQVLLFGRRWRSKHPRRAPPASSGHLTVPALTDPVLRTRITSTRAPLSTGRRVCRR